MLFCCQNNGFQGTGMGRVPHPPHRPDRRVLSAQGARRREDVPLEPRRTPADKGGQRRLHSPPNRREL